MTTKITVHATAGKSVQVTDVDPVTNLVNNARVVLSGSEEIFYVHSTKDLRIHEIQPDEDTPV